MPTSSVKRLDEKLDSLIASSGESKTSIAVLTEHMVSVDRAVSSLADHVEKQNGRIRKLENWRVAVVAVGGFIGVIAKVLFDLFTK